MVKNKEKKRIIKIFCLNIDKKLRQNGSMKWAIIKQLVKEETMYGETTAASNKARIKLNVKGLT